MIVYRISPMRKSALQTRASFALDTGEILLLDTPCTAGARSLNFFEILMLVWTLSRLGISPKTWEWSFVHPTYRPTQDRNDCDLVPFPPVKPHGHFLHIFFKKVNFFHPKKGSPNRLILFLKARLGGSTFRTPKNRCVKLPVSTSMCPPPYLPLAKMNYFPDEARTNEERTFQILHSPK